MNNKTKIFSFLTAITLIAALFAGCGKAEKTSINIAALKGPTAIGMLKLMSDSEAGEASNSYNFEVLGTADEVVARLINGELDIAAVPCNLASVLYNKTEGGVKVAAINTLGVLYITDTTGGISAVSDLKGKTLYTVGKGTTPEFALNYVLTKNGLIPGEDVIIEFKSEAAELSALVASGMADIAMLPEPALTAALSKNPDAKIALSLSDEWDKVQSDFGLITGVIVVRTEFLDKNKAAFDSFLSEYKQSIAYINANIDEGAVLTAKYDIVAEAIAKQAIPRCNIVYIDGKDMETGIKGYLGTLFEADAKSVGGKLPDDNFYYKK